MEQYRIVLEKLIQGLTAIFGARTDQILLYGSVARGEQTEESDIDIAVLLHGGYTQAMHDQMTDFAVELELEYDVVLSILLIDHDNYLEWRDTLPFYRNVRSEGVVLWPAA
jgi:predicted nucleotidyltransferase